jgi:ATP adenylyltransferase/5',5'''-P-1,P-4-tetraphosphate phosphorylase II
MIRDKIISIDTLASFGETGNTADLLKGLLAQQKTVWPQLEQGYRSLETVRTKEFGFDGFRISIQFNPGRITSSAAKVDPESIKERKCFLCPANLPAEQQGIGFGEVYLILCNPFPIFPEHFTIPHIEHIPQRIQGALTAMLDLTAAIGDSYTVFYNGPRCGASAPDHLHFQAGSRNFMLIERECDRLIERYGQQTPLNDTSSIACFDDGLRRALVLETDDKGILHELFNTFYDLYNDTTEGDEEPMMNILSQYDTASTRWRLIIFMREKHRPSFYFEEGDENLLLSPAAVDFGGVCITPLEKDFQKIQKEDIIRMFEEVTIDKNVFRNICNGMNRLP